MSNHILKTARTLLVCAACVMVAHSCERSTTKKCNAKIQVAQAGVLK